MDSGWNTTAPNEIYVTESRFMASAAGLNTIAHEADHDRRGPRPPDRERAQWESIIQATADRRGAYDGG